MASFCATWLRTVITYSGWIGSPTFSLSAKRPNDFSVSRHFFEAGFQMLVAFFAFQQRQNGLDCGLDGPTSPMSPRSSLDLRPRCSARSERCEPSSDTMPYRESPCPGATRLLLFRARNVRSQSLTSGHSNGIKIFAVEEFFPSKTVCDWRLDGIGKLKNFFLRSGATRATEQGHPVHLIQ